MAAAKPPRAPSALVTAYLISYNSAALAGWCYLLFALYAHLAQRFLRAQPLYGASLWAATALPMKAVLTSSLLEILHALLRLVPANPATTALQGAFAAAAPQLGGPTACSPATRPPHHHSTPFFTPLSPPRSAGAAHCAVGHCAPLARGAGLARARAVLLRVGAR